MRKQQKKWSYIFLKDNGCISLTVCYIRVNDQEKSLRGQWRSLQEANSWVAMGSESVAGVDGGVDGGGLNGVSWWELVVVDHGLGVVRSGDINGHGNTSVLVFGMLDGHFWLDGLGHFSWSVAYLQSQPLKSIR